MELEKGRRGVSLNQIVIELLAEALGSQRFWSDGRGRLVGGWSEEEFGVFERATAPFEEVDEELWS